jgi:hypothetical protein
MKARILVPAIGASLALIGPATHAAAAHNALHCTVAKQAHTATAQKPFFSPLNPRGLLAAQAKQCATKKLVVQKPKPRPKQPAQPVTPSPVPTFPTTPGVPFCLVYLDYPEYELAPCGPVAPATVAAPAQAAQDTSGEPPLADVEQAAQDS